VDDVEKMPGTEMVKFVANGHQYGYAIFAGFVGRVYENDLEYLAGLGVIDWRKPKQIQENKTVLVLKHRKKHR
jgi:hypothetical protein